MLENALSYSHTLLQAVVHPGDLVVDATIGNGRDTLFLAQLVGPTGQVLGFDNQPQAIQATQALLKAHNVANRVQLVAAGHETVSQYLPKQRPLGGAIFNLGYLPGGDKSQTTQAPTTIAALDQLLPHLRHGGRIILVVYYGHPGSEIEKKAVTDYCQRLSQMTYTVLQYQFINQQHQPPFVLAIERR